jgi:membrane protein required for colicin V production
VKLLDILLLLIVVFSVVTGFMGGFARVGIGFIAAIAGVLAGFWFYGIPAGWLAEYLGPGAAASLLGFFLVFLVFVVAGHLTGMLLSRVFKWVGLTWLDRIVGAGFGFVRGVVIVVAVVTVITAFAPNPPPRFLVNSRIMPYATRAGSAFAAMAPRELKDSYHFSVNKLRRIWSDNIRIHANPRKLAEQTL